MAGKMNLCAREESEKGLFILKEKLSE